LAYTIWYSKEPNGGGDFTTRFLQTVVYSRPITDSLTYIFQSDFGVQGDCVTATGDRTARWYGLNQYLFREINDEWTVGLRAEWFRDEQGYRVGGFLGDTSGGSLRGLSSDRSGYPGSFYEITLGANWKPNPNFIIRPSVRWDWFSGSADNAGGLLPFNDGKGTTQILVGGDIILLF
jgi:hypothetical protein